jgi:excisionase family DNA binding protein
MRLLTARQAQELTQLSRARIYEAARLGLIPCVRIGRQVRFDEETLRRWAELGGSARSSSGSETLGRG